MKLLVNRHSRLDLYVAVETGRSRSFVKHQILTSRVSLNGEVIDKPSQKLKPEDVLDIEFNEQAPLSLLPIEKQLTVLYEDEDLIVLNKEQGWVVHPASAHRGETLVHYLLYYFQNTADFAASAPLRPGIVHRLDRGTSGCLVVAKHRPALENLCKQFKDRTVEKEYEAIVWGRAKASGLIATAIGRHLSDRKRMSAKTRLGKEAQTRFETMALFNHFSWVRLLPKTGRTHQLRVHLSEAGHPMVGDILYGKKRDLSHFSEGLRALLQPIRYPFLHARRISFTQPTTGKRIMVEADLPESFQKVLAQLSRNEMREPDEI